MQLEKIKWLEVKKKERKMGSGGRQTIRDLISLNKMRVAGRWGRGRIVGWGEYMLWLVL